ncbi:MAG: winged helix-turn-helix domain-containing protein [Pyrinomonadaceae bacterium]
MTPSKSDPWVYSFRGFRLDPARRLLHDPAGKRVALPPKAFDTLLYLVGNAGRLIGKDELMSAIWSDSIVEENNLNKNVSVLRRVLGDALASHRFIVTVPGQGYKFVADVEMTSNEAKVTDVPAAYGGNRSPRSALFLLVAVILLLIATSAYFVTRRANSDKQEPFRTVAILPFRPLVSDYRDESLELGMADALISRLGTIPGLIVRPLSSVRGFTALDQDAKTAGEALSADSVVDGTIQRWGDEVRVTVRLLNVEDGSVLWSEAYDEKFTNIFSVQNLISTRIASALALQLNAVDQRRIEKKYTADPDAYESYLRGRYHVLKVTEPEIRKAISFYELAVEHDPNYALAYAGMADAYRVLASAAYAPGREVCPKAKELADRAIALDETISEAHAVLGWIAFLYDWDRDSAEKEFRRAIELSRNDSEAHRGYAHFLSNALRHDEAINEGRLARELAPLTLITSALEAQFLLYAGHDQEALVRAKKTIELDPDFWVAHNIVGRVLIREGKFSEAFSELQRAFDLSGGSSEPVMQLGYAYARSGDRENALKQLRLLGDLKQKRFVPEYNFAVIYNGLGDKDKAFEHLTKAVEEREVQLSFIAVDARWDDLRKDSRYVQIIDWMRTGAVGVSGE